MVRISTLAIRRATTCTLRRSVSVKAARIDPSCSRQAKSTGAQEAAEQPRGVELGAVIGDALESEARDRQRFASMLGRLHGAIEITPERRRVKQAGIGIDDALGLERFQHALELTLERLQAHEWEEFARPGPQDRNRPGADWAAARHPRRHCPARRSEGRETATSSASRVKSSCDYAGAQAFADDYAVDVASVEIARGSLDAQHPNQPDPLADCAMKARDRSRRVRRKARLHPRADQAG